MKIYAHSNINTEIATHTSTFPGGEQHIRITNPDVEHYNSYDFDEFRIETLLNSSDAIMRLAMAVDALRRLNDVPISLLSPYLPYARQDRVCHPGEALSLKVMCNMLNAMQFASVEVWDVHSTVALALLDRVIHTPASHFVKYIGLSKEWVFVAPDTGATARVRECAQIQGHAVLRAHKTRGLDGGVRTTLDVPPGKRDNLLIVDDICDGGRTFIELAKVLRQYTNGKIMLYVTHGIFSQGLSVFDSLIDHIYCPNIWPNVHRNGNITKLGEGEFKP